MRPCGCKAGEWCRVCENIPRLSVPAWWMAGIMLVVILGAMLSGCDNVVKQEPHPDRATVYTGRTGCTHPGFCVACGMDFHGKLSCGPKFRPMCPGQQTATIRATPWTVTRESGAVAQETRTEVLARHGSCM